MPPFNFGQFQDEFFRLYEAGSLEDAALLIQLIGGLFPERAGSIYNWRICLAARQGQNDEALKLFQEALDLGLWWPEPMLRTDPDLARLQGKPEFERMLTVSKQRHIQAFKTSQPEMLLYMPDETAPRPYPLIVVLHGRFGNARETGDAWQSLAAQGWLVAAAQSSQIQGFNAYTWDSAEKGTREIIELGFTLFQKQPIDLNRVVLAGFSQGGALAIRLALSGILAPIGFLAVAPFNREEDPFFKSGPAQPGPSSRANKGPANRTVRGYMITGGKDPRVKKLEILQKFLEASQVPMRIENHPELGHAYPPDFDHTLRLALQFILEK